MDEPVPVAANREEVGVRFLEAVGREGAQVGGKFRCVLPNHEDDQPSAQVYRDERNFLRYRCWAGRHRKNGWPLAQVWAYVRTHQETVLEQWWKAGFLLVWQARMLLDLDLLSWPDLGLTDPPADAPSSAQAVWAGFKASLACRRLHDLTNMYAAPFSKDFAAVWCGISKEAAWNGLRWLTKRGWLNHIGQMPLGNRRVNVYATGPSSSINVTWLAHNPDPGILLVAKDIPDVTVAALLERYRQPRSG